MPRPDAPAQSAPDIRDDLEPAALTPGEMAMFEAGMRRAVQQALVYPAAARMAHAGGEVRVRFDFMNGKAFNPILVGSSGLPVLDRAALATVTQAQYPPPPPFLAHRSVNVTVVVRYNPDQTE